MDDNGELGSSREGPDVRSTGDDVGPSGSALFVRGLAVGAVLVGFAWALVAAVTGGSDTTDATPTSGTVVTSATPVAPQQPTRLQRCAVAAQRLTAPLDAADPAMDQWEVHVGAMNKLVVGAITLRQASAFWNQTRLGAYRRIERFDRAMQQLRKHGVDCPDPQVLRTGSSDVLRVCAHRVAAQMRTLDAAETAITTWRSHVRDMDRLRLGQLSASAATQMWLSMWHQGVRQLEQYRIAERSVRRQPACGTTQLPPTVPGNGSAGTDGSGMDMDGMDMSG
jgi:hypothetical protein